MDDSGAIRKWIVEQVSLIIDNDSHAHGQVTEAALRAVTDMDSPEAEVGGSLRDQYAYHCQRGANGAARDRYVHAVGSAVAETIDGWIDDAGDSLIARLLREVLDLTDSVQIDMFGQHYLPEVDDVEKWAELFAPSWTSE
jgi:hypothetical protein